MRKILALALTGVAAVAVAAVAFAANNPQRSDVVTKNCNNAAGQKEGTVKYDGVVVAWPPNHKYRTATITLTDDDAEPLTDGVTVGVVGTHDQVLSDGSEMNGSGNTDPATDVLPGPPGTGQGSASTTVQFRGERSGHEKDGRTYTFTVQGMTDNSTTPCSQTFTATVPHDQRKAK